MVRAFGTSPRSLARRKRPDDLNAYELYLLGGEKCEQLTSESVAESIPLLKRAVEIDPASPEHGLSCPVRPNGQTFASGRQGRRGKQAWLATNRAVELDPVGAQRIFSRVRDRWAR